MEEGSKERIQITGPFNFLNVGGVKMHETFYCMCVSQYGLERPGYESTALNSTHMNAHKRV